MIPKTKSAIEEAAKLPTAYQSAQEHNAVDKYGKPQSEVLAAIESHTAAHTAALRDQIADLDRENNNYRLVYDSVVKNRDELRERVKELEAKIASYESAIDGLKKVVDSLYKLRS